MWRWLGRLLGADCRGGEFHDWETVRSVDRADIENDAVAALFEQRNGRKPSFAEHIPLCITYHQRVSDRVCLRCGLADERVGAAVAAEVERLRERERRQERAKSLMQENAALEAELGEILSRPEFKSDDETPETSRGGIGRCGYSSTYSADELHERVIEALGSWCERQGSAGLAARDRFLVDHLARPLEQTVTGTLSMVLDESQRSTGVAVEHDVATCEPVSYLTDDRDAKPGQGLNELLIFSGGNGDWYVGVVPKGHGHFNRTVRISTSGGAASACPGLPAAIAAAFRAMARAAKKRGELS